MKTLFILALISLGTTTVNAKEKMTMEARKAKATARADKRIATINEFKDKKIAVLNEFKSCVNSASEKGAIKACRTTKKGKMETIRAARKAARKANKKK